MKNQRVRHSLWRIGTALMLALGLAAGLARAPQPGAAASEPATFFTQTGHQLGSPFLDYWQNNGGLARFGYPISEVFTDRSAIDGHDYQTQYFERAVFEYHPENGPDWQVELRLLGRALVQGRQNEPAFQPVGPDDTRLSYYFAETGHTLGGAFAQYREQNGGLPVYGYPLSEEFTEVSPSDGKPYTVQYFERARFEFHPEYAGSDHEVELGLLGQQAAQHAGLAGHGSFAALYSHNLSLTWHRQMTDDWCDPADIQSWTEYLTGRHYPDDTAIQSQVWDYELAHNLGYTVEQWDASPYAMAAALHWLNPGYGFNHWIYDDPVEATKVLAYNLAAPGGGQPAIAVIRGGTHYILVKGVVADSDPYANYPNAHILGLWVSDPFIDYPGAEAKWLGQDGYLTLDQWLGIFDQNHWGVPGDPWQDKYITVQMDWQNMDPAPGGRRLSDFHAWAGK
ncbi:MAG: hypothetical protein ACTHMR_03645 [Thermomicrobiales bacterium]